MSCDAPLTGYRSKEIGKSGKRGITFQRNASFNGLAIRIPCGQCTGCRLEKSRQWAMRCMHEKRLHTDNCFITLTYNDDHLPQFGTLIKRDFQLFMKRLRKEKGDGIRFFACGEYGDLNRRPHYHSILFNCDFDDKLLIGRNRRGDPYYDSKSLQSIWSLDGKAIGRVLIGDVTFDSAAYVARYTLKKITGKRADDHYEVINGDGELFHRLPEFNLMSRKPGIGAGYYERYGSEVRAHDNVIINGRPVRPPRFYDLRTELIDPARMAVLKSIRRQELAKNRKENIDPSRRRVKEIFRDQQMKTKRREL